MKILTARLRIRPLVVEDLQDFHVYRSDPAMAKYQGYKPMSEEQAEAFIRENSVKGFGNPGEWVQYGIENLENGNLIGDCAIKLDGESAEIGISISPLHQKNRYAKEVLSGILDLLFREHHIDRVVERVDAENTASLNLLKSVGFREDGYFPDVLYKGVLCDEFQFIMSKIEWEGRERSIE
ncbi:GNAT family N-acetyltransferase [Salinimicrobium flavum]|uniref:GNAT family N-acetyltransferase n=1 Tax=Salinimicrobium flavum TaxID=1737065 RepID=A0ABW5IRX9_9FLAO